MEKTNDKKLSLKKRIEDLIDEIGIKQKLTVNLNCKYQKDQISLNVLYHLPLIIKEALINVLKHAQARKVDLEIYGNDSELIITIVDDGAGFTSPVDYTRSISGEMQGIKNMAGRTEILGGRINIKSRPGKGTRIEIVLPYLK